MAQVVCCGYGRFAATMRAPCLLARRDHEVLILDMTERIPGAGNPIHNSAMQSSYSAGPAGPSAPTPPASARPLLPARPAEDDPSRSGGVSVFLLGVSLLLIFPALLLFLREHAVALGLQKLAGPGLSLYAALQIIRFLKFLLLFGGLSLCAGALAWKSAFVGLVTGTRLERVSESVVLLLIVAVTLPLYLALDVVVFKRFPLTPDEFAYLFQAKLFASGHLTAATHPLQKFFTTAFLAEAHGRRFSIMPPGYSLFLVPWIWLGCAWLASPVLSTGSVLLAYRLGCRVYDRATGLMAALLMSVSPFFLYYTSGQMTHALSLFLVLIAVHAYLRFTEQEVPGWRQSLVLGLILALLPAVHHFDVFILVPLMLLLVGRFWKGPNPLRVRILLTGLVFLGSTVLSMLWYNFALTGSVWKIPLEVYLEGKNFLGHPGYGIPPDGAMVGIASWAELLRHLRRLGGQIMKLNVVLFPLAPLLMICPLFSRRRLRWDVLLAACLAVLLASYLFYRPWGGLEVGPRYYYLGIAFMYLLIVRGFLGWYHWEEGRAASRRGFRQVASVCLLLAVCYQVGIAAGYLRVAEDVVDEWREIEEVGARFAERGMTNSVIFLTATEKELRNNPELLFLLTRNQPGFTDTNLAAMDRGRENLELMDFYPDRRYFLYEVDRDNFVRGTAMRWRELHREDYLRSDMPTPGVAGPEPSPRGS